MRTAPSNISGQVSNGTPVGYFFTWPTYGSWLPGNERGWVEYRHGWQLPNPFFEANCRLRMSEATCWLTAEDRLIVANQIQETCQHRRWLLYAANCRSNHVHALLAAENVNPKKVRDDLKAWCTRRLNERSAQQRDKWWAERGSIRWVWDQHSLDTVMVYINEAQDGVHRT